MYSREEIVKMTEKYVTSDGVRHISDMLEEIQHHMLTGRRNSNFVELCAKEDWVYAAGVADKMNKEILTQTPLFKDFVKDIKREKRLNFLIKDVE